MGGKTKSSRERVLILKVLKYFEKEKEISKLAIPAKRKENVTKEVMIPVDQPINRTIAATGVSKSTLLRIKKQVADRKSSPVPGTSSAQMPRPWTPGKKRKPSALKITLGGFELVALRNIVNSFYTIRKEVPTLNKILAAAQSDMNFPGGKTTLRQTLANELGYKFKKCKNSKSVLIQKPYIAAWRARYLRKMKENEDLGPLKKPITYLDETSIFSEDDTRKNSYPVPNWILVSAGGENGFISGAELLYNDEIDTKSLLMWIEEKIIPKLPPNGIVVVDSAFHPKQTGKLPSRTSLKSEIQTWLLKHNISFEENMTKPELYHLVITNKTEKRYVVDELLKEHGHEVLRLPPNHCDLNPMQYIWNLIKQRVADQNIVESIENIKKLTGETMKTITNADWAKSVNHVKMLQKDYWESDRFQELKEREVILCLGGEDSSSDSDGEKTDSDMSGIEELIDSDDSI